MTKQNNNQTSDARVSILNAIQKPINFFALVVLVVEAILGVTANFSQGTDRTYLIIGMLILIFVLVLIVAGFAFFRPEALSGKRPTATKHKDGQRLHSEPSSTESTEDMKRKLIILPAYEMLLIPGYDLSLIADILEGFERSGNVDLGAISHLRNITPSTIEIIINSMMVRGYLEKKGQTTVLAAKGRELLTGLRSHFRSL